MTLDLCWFLSPPAATVAQARGFYADRGLAVRGHTVGSSDEQYERIAAGASVAGVTAMDNVFAWNLRGTVDDLRVVAQVERSTHSVLMGAPGIETIAALKGGTLLVDAPENGFVVVTRALLREAGLAPGDYRLDVVGGVRARLDALANGRGDAALLVPLFERRILDAGGRVLARVEAVFPGYPGQGLVARRSRLDEHGPALSAWLAALREAEHWARMHRREAVAIIAGETGLGLAAAEILLDDAPYDQRPDEAALALLVKQRRALGMPGADGGVAALFDPCLTDRRAI